MRTLRVLTRYSAGTQRGTQRLLGGTPPHCTHRPARQVAPGVFLGAQCSAGYRGRLWTFRQYSGFGSAEETNERYKFLIQQGQTGLSVALDLPTQCGYDPTDPMASSEVGKVGVPIATLADAEILFDGLDLAKLSTSFTINDERDPGLT